jgi:hypothetical protein
VSWYHDAENHIVTEAQDLQVNYSLLPPGTFDFSAPERAFVIHGDVDPHVLALPVERPASFDRHPVREARYEAWKRRGAVGFPVLAPEWLPDGYRLIRVRSKMGRWLDAHWIRAEGETRGQVIKLVEQDERVEPPGDLASAGEVNLGTANAPVSARMKVGSEPYACVYLTWKQGGVRCTLFAAELSPEQVQHIARSMTQVSGPEPATVSIPRDRYRSPTGEPSELPSDQTAASSDEMKAHEPDGSPTAAEDPTTAEQQPPMMPEMPDLDPGSRARTASSPAMN